MIARRRTQTDAGSAGAAPYRCALGVVVGEFRVANHLAGTVNAKSLTVASTQRTEVGRSRAVPEGGSISQAACVARKGISRDLPRIVDPSGETLPAGPAEVDKGIG